MRMNWQNTEVMLECAIDGNMSREFVFNCTNVCDLNKSFEKARILHSMIFVPNRCYLTVPTMNQIEVIIKKGTCVYSCCTCTRSIRGSLSESRISAV